VLGGDRGNPEPLAIAAWMAAKGLGMIAELLNSD